MMTKLSRWLLYNSSYIIGYILIGISKGISTYNGKKKDPAFQALSHIGKCKSIILENALLYIALGAFIIVGLLWLIYFLHWKNNRKIKYRMENDSSMEMIGFLLPYIVSMVTITIDFYGMLLNLVIWLILGAVFVSNNLLRSSPLFFLCGYKVYNSDKIYVITKMTREEYNLALEDNPDGIEARELAKNVFITFKS